MHFFFQLLNGVSAQYPQIFGGEDEDDEDTDEGGEEERTSKDRSPNGGNEGYNWLALLKEVSDLTKLDWARCWELPIHEFFTYCSFSREYNRRQIAMMKAANGIKTY